MIRFHVLNGYSVIIAKGSNTSSNMDIFNKFYIPVYFIRNKFYLPVYFIRNISLPHLCSYNKSDTSMIINCKLFIRLFNNKSTCIRYSFVFLYVVKRNIISTVSRPPVDQVRKNVAPVHLYPWLCGVNRYSSP